ncbi:MAG: nucleoside phosphorylase [Candidatus Thorarchaeota archaeon]|nr:nucleoside phosphorylase [Candidatus Thorarchaeota archaeon]
MEKEREYHIGVAPGELPELVLLPGDPDRARLIAESFFQSPEQVAKKREYWSFRGKHHGVGVAVCSTGIGCPAAAIALEELIRVGCTTFIRVGTAGAIDPTLCSGDLVILTGVVRNDGTSRQYVPIEFPAVADFGLIQLLTEQATARGVRFRVGIGHSKDAFYSEFPHMVASPEHQRQQWESLRRARVIATEMESAALYTIGHLRGVRVATICTIVGESVDKEARIDRLPPLDNMVLTALDALAATMNSK